MLIRRGSLSSSQEGQNQEFKELKLERYWVLTLSLVEDSEVSVIVVLEQVCNSAEEEEQIDLQKVWIAWKARPFKSLAARLCFE